MKEPWKLELLYEKFVKSVISSVGKVGWWWYVLTQNTSNVKDRTVSNHLNIDVF